MAALDLLTDPSVAEELESLKQHATFLSEQIRRANEHIKQARRISQTGAVNESDTKVVKRLQTEVIENVRNLEETVRRIQTLLGLPVEEDVQMDSLEKDRLGAHPVMEDGSVETAGGYGILDRLPKIRIGDDHVVLPQPGVADTFLRRPRQADEETVDEEEIERELKAKDRLVELVEKKHKAKEQQLKAMQDANGILRDTLSKLKGDNDLVDVIANEEPPRDDAEAERYLEALNGEIQKIDKVKEKVRNELRHQYRVNSLINNKREFPEIAGDSTWSRLFDMDTELSLNNELLAYEELKKEQRRRLDENNRMKNETEILNNENIELRDKIDRGNQELRELGEIGVEIEKTKAVEEMIAVKESELKTAHGRLQDIDDEQRVVTRLLEEQEAAVVYYREKFMETQGEFEARSILICQERKDHETRVEDVRREMESFQATMEAQLEKYRPLPIALGLTLVKAFTIESQKDKLIRENQALERDLACHLAKAEDLVDELRVHEDKAEAYRSDQKRVEQLRDHYEQTEHVLNRHRKVNLAKAAELEHVLHRIAEDEAEIGKTRETIDYLKESFARKNFAAQQEADIKVKARLGEIGELEMDIAKKRGLIKILKEMKPCELPDNMSCHMLDDALSSDMLEDDKSLSSNMISV